MNGVFLMHDVSQGTRSKRSELTSAFYTMSDVAGICGLGYSTLWTQVQEGSFPVTPVKLGRQWRFPKTEIDRLAGWDVAESLDRV
jgi:predicted DNA-binding transcriptional regulator AlpA